jgi:tripartite-type tricarboxylate transporter receptor subunit TctC
MKLPRRQFLHLAAGAAALPAMSRIARAQAYPTRPVRIIVAYAAGGPNDLFARLISQWLSDRLGQQFIVEHRAGAGGTIGTEATVRAPADGYTLLLASTGNKRIADQELCSWRWRRQRCGSSEHRHTFAPRSRWWVTSPFPF